jgi:hypothetical protein
MVSGAIVMNGKRIDPDNVPHRLRSSHGFVSYAREDEELYQQLKKHLRILEREGLIDFDDDRAISPGTEWEGQISEWLERADVILLLISADFVDSDYCWDVEMRRALERHEDGEARVIPVILREVAWKDSVLSFLEVLPTSATPATSPKWASLDSAFTDVVNGIRRTISESRRQKQGNLAEEHV